MVGREVIHSTANRVTLVRIQYHAPAWGGDDVLAFPGRSAHIFGLTAPPFSFQI